MSDLGERALRLREQILHMGASPGGAHLGGSLSCLDILLVLYSEVLRVRPDDPQWPDRDWFVLSKGHASAALYAVLADAGFFPMSECDTYAATGSRLAGHPLRRLPGVEFPTGSLGHGLSLGAGVALAAQRGGRPNRAFVLLGDGELQEGSVWEAAMFAPTVGLDNLVAIVDRNGWQITGRTDSLEPLADRWRSFGWDVIEVDGHDFGELRLAFGAPRTRPTVVLATTVKGRGVPLLEDKKKSHHVTLSPALLNRTLAGLRARARRMS